MNLELRDLERLLALLPGRQRRRLEAHLVQLAGPDAVWAALETLDVVDGWLVLTDRVLAFDRPGRVARADTVPLDGELRLSDDESIHLRHEGEGRWRLTRLTRLGDPQGCVTERRFFRRGDPGRVLRYDVCWELAADAFGQPVLQPRRTRFAGFGPAGEE